MNTLFAKAFWEVYERPLPWFIDQVLANGWDATEIFIEGRPESRSEILRRHQDAGLKLIAQICSSGATPAEHLVSLRENYLRALECEPLFVTSHTGSDLYTFEQNRPLFEAAVELAAQHGTPLLHETHRGRALFTGPLCKAYLDAVPGLRLTADFSHLLCVHESNLWNQQDTVNAIIHAADHIHGRIGFNEGPQVGDPRNPCYGEWVNLSIGFWSRIRERQIAEGRAHMTLTPEFGPAASLYAPLGGLEAAPVGDPWEINHWVREELRRRWELGKRGAS